MNGNNANEEKYERKKIQTFDTLRVVFCVSIFLNHCSFLKDNRVGDVLFESFLHNGRFGVTFFFVLSAFCIYRSYRNYDFKVENYFHFIFNRIKKIYPLYVCTNLYVAFFQVINGRELVSVVKEFVLSLTLLQTMSIKYWGILNSVGWFLSTIFVLYVLSPFLIIFIRRLHNTIIIAIIACILFAIIPVMDFCVALGAHAGMYSEEVSKLLNYVFPIYWIPIYAIGMIFGKISFNINIDRNRGEYTFLETATIIISLIIYLCGINGVDWMLEYKSIFYVLSCVSMVVVFSLEKGSISLFLSNSKLTKLSKYNSEIYLLHYAVIFFGGIQCLCGFSTTLMGSIFELIVFFFITVLLSFFWEMIQNKLMKERKKYAE